MINFNINQLEAFCAVAKHLSFSKAAASLGISQAAVSNRIANLEIDFGCDLFERDRHSTKLSYEGQTLLEEAKFILARCQDLQRTALGFSQNRESKLRIGYSPLVALPNDDVMQQAILTEYPELDFELHDQSSLKCYDEVRGGVLDFAVVNLVKEQLVGLDYLTMDAVDFVFVCHKSHPLAELPAPTKLDLAKHRQLLLKSNASEAELLPRIAPKATVSNSLIGILDYLQAQMGWSIIPKIMFERYGDMHELVTLSLDVDQAETRMQAVLIWSKTKPLGPIGQGIVRIMRKPQ
ncbi:LysR family transcriptional regulator [Paraferrimonas haliotis]|uniref:LysR family transcriptional regulator n=1 Tax=Paraferrimonas haliotis TaxID=2013866 RepID=A0AA37TK88_9GAMM|nr:LysR family transcriptional regulator [Paraferrimonas haliotis]GLS82754.1 LysR family transcriptional regulator [Paraferrimonas haliotis]